MERLTIDKDYGTHNIIGSDKRRVHDHEININEQSITTICPCGLSIEIYSDVTCHCACGRDHELVTYILTEWAENTYEGE